QDQVILRWEMLVQAHLGDAGLGDDPVDADGPDAFLVEQPVGGFQDAAPRLRRLSFAFHALNIQTCLFIVKTPRLTRGKNHGRSDLSAWRWARGEAGEMRVKCV